jgi:hypothetical protein
MLYPVPFRHRHNENVVSKHSLRLRAAKTIPSDHGQSNSYPAAAAANARSRDPKLAAM